MYREFRTSLRYFLYESEQICQKRVELRRVGGVNTPVGSRRELVANCVHTAEGRRDSTQQLRRVGVSGVYWTLAGV